MVLDLRKKFVSAQYPENKLTDFHLILYMHSYRQDLAWDCHTSFLAHFYQSYGPWFTPKFRFCSISREQIDLFSPNFIYAFILTRSSLGLMHVIFTHLYQIYGPWFTPKFRFRSISWEQMDRISPNFIYAFILTRSTLGLLHIIFRTFVPELWPLIYAKISFPFNILRTNFYQILYMQSYWQDLCWDSYTSFCAYLYLDLLQNFVSAQYLENKLTDFDQTLYNYLYWQDLYWDC